MLWMLPAWPCTSWELLSELAAIQHPNLTESSGLAPGRRVPGTLWTHDDSGAASLFRFSLDGTVTEHEVPQADNKDWEDIASAGCAGGGDCLYVGDIGIDRGDTGSITVYVVKEPRADGIATLKQRWELTWPGVPRDAEALLVHPCTLDAWIVTKGEVTEVFRIPDNRGPNPVPLEPVATLAIDEPVTAGDVSPDGTAVVLRSDDKAWWLPLGEGGSFGAPQEIVDGLPPGEGLGWDLDGDLLFTSEGFPTAVGRMACAGEPPIVCEPKGCGCRHGGGSPLWLFVVALYAEGLRRRLAGRHVDHHP